MRDKNIPIAKITRPAISGICQRERLFLQLDEGNRPITWICGPGGSGKTTLVAGWLDSRQLPCLWYQVDQGDGDLATFFYYMGLAAQKAAPKHKKPLPLLTPEYLQGIPTFTRRFFENLYTRLKSSNRFVIVLDNYQDASGPAFQEMMSHALDAVPGGIKIIVLSRADVPPHLARLRANDRIGFIVWDDIRFTLEESREVLETLARKKISDESLTALHGKTEGWAAGLVLLTANAAAGLTEKNERDCLSSEGAFDYFASEIFDKMPPLTQHFLLVTAFLPGMSVSMAEELTDNKDAKDILEELSRRHYFTQKYATGEWSYQYHALFREFLLVRSKRHLGKEERLSYKRKAAQLLQASGRTEDAATLLIAEEEWDSLIHLVLSEAQALMSQGRSKTLEHWIVAIPEEIRRNNAWLIFWTGVCRMPFNPGESRLILEKAFERFKAEDEMMGMYLSWAFIVDTYIHEWDDLTPLDAWIEWLHAKDVKDVSLPPEIDARLSIAMLTALIYRQPNHPEIEYWLERAINLAHESNDVNLSLYAYSNAASYILWIGDYDRMSIIRSHIRKFERSPRVSPLSIILWRFLDAVTDLGFAASVDSAEIKLNDALKLAEDTGVHIWDQMLLGAKAYCFLLKGDISAAEKMLAMIEAMFTDSRRHMRCNYHYLAAWCAALKEDKLSAGKNIKIALKLAEETGFLFPEILNLITAANILKNLGNGRDSLDLLNRAEGLCKKTKSPLLAFSCLIARAAVNLEMGLERDGLNCLEEALKLGKKRLYLALPWWWHPSDMSMLCSKALEHGIEVSYAQRLISQRRLVSPDGMTEGWPYPIKIYTLGRFDIIKENKPVEFAGKVQKKPLEMLKAIIALGGRDVSEDQLADLLWPDADGGSVGSTFRSTLHRLRQMIGNDDALTVKEGRVSLDPRHCWVDAWAFQQTVSEVERGRKEAGSDRFRRIIEKGVEMYNGDFLSNEKKLPWTVSMRERHKAGFVRLVDTLGRIYITDGEFEKATELYQKAIDIDDLQESFYRNLMQSYGRLGRKTNVQTTYHRCGKILSVCGLEPSEETKAAYKQAIHGD